MNYKTQLQESQVKPQHTTVLQNIMKFHLFGNDKTCKVRFMMNLKYI